MDYASSVQAVALRICKLDTDGTPLVGTESAFVTDSLTQVSWTPEYKAGEELTQTGANGQECVYYKMPSTLRKVNLNIAICNPQPEIYAMLAGGAVLLGQSSGNVTNKARAGGVATVTSAAHGFQVGDAVTVTGVDPDFDGTHVLTAVTANTFSYASAGADVASGADTGSVRGPDHTAGTVGYAAPGIGEIPNLNGLGVEVWSRRIVEGRPAAVPFWRWVFPFATFQMDGERVLGNNVLANSFTGEGLANSAFGAGPAGDWDFGGFSAMQFAQDAAAPTDINDFFEVAA